MPPEPRTSPGRRLSLALGAASVALVILIGGTFVLRRPGTAPTSLAVAVTSSSGNWRLQVLASEPLPTDRVLFMTRKATGDAFSPLVALPDLPPGYFIDQMQAGLLDPGDAVVLPQSLFLAGLTYWFLNPDRLLAVGTLD